MYLHPQFQTDVIKPLRIDELMDQEVQHLSGGELQRVAITMCLGKEADLYLIDEPSAYLDSEQRIIAAKVGCIAASQAQALRLLLRTVGLQHVGYMLLQTIISTHVVHHLTAVRPACENFDVGVASAMQVSLHI